MRLPRLFSDGMVLQQRIPIPVWGWSTPGRAIRVTLAGHGAETVANARGMWMVKLPSLAAAPAKPIRAARCARPTTA